ncbi:MAG: tetratricopeptide repeat protein [Phycisphaerales bacterium]
MRNTDPKKYSCIVRGLSEAKLNDLQTFRRASNNTNWYNKFLHFFIIFFFLAIASEGAVRSGSYPNSIEEVLKLDNDKIDLASSVLLVSKRWNNQFNSNYYINFIDRIAQEVREKAGPNASNSKICETINSVLFTKMGFKAIDSADNPDDLFLNTVIDNKRGYCLSLSILYLCIGEKLDLPLYGVVAPGHFFVRCDDGGNSFNIETTQMGGSAPDSHYIEKFNIPDNASQGVYLRNLTKKETIGCLFNNLANVYMNKEQIEYAFYYQKLSVALTPMLAEARTNLGNIYLRKNMTDLAIQQYENALEINPQDAKTHHNLGNAYRKKGIFDAAIKQYNIALKLDPNYVEIYKGLAWAYHSKGIDEKAIVYLKTAADINSRDPDIYIALAGIYRDRKNWDAAISNYRRALIVKTDSVDAAYGLGYVFFQKEMYYEALEQYRTAVYYQPLNANAHMGLALVYEKLNWPEEEIQSYKNAINADPNFAGAYQNLANIYMERKQYDLAASNYETAVKLSPKDADLYFNLGVSNSARELYEPAKEYYLKTIELKWNFPAAHNNLAVTLYSLGKYEQALNHAKIAKQQGYDVSEDFLNQLTKLVENKR